MRILVFIHEFPPIGGGGGRAAYDVCKKMVERGHEVTVISAHLRGLKFSECVDGIRLIRIPSLRREAFSASFLAMLLYVMIGFWAGLFEAIRMRPDVFHSHFTLPAGALVWALSLVTGTPYILTAHLGDVPGGVPEKTDKWFFWLRPFTHPIWKRAKQVIAVSEFTRQLILSEYKVPVDVIHNGVDLREIAVQDIKVNRPPVIIFAGRFVEQKNPEIIVTTLAQALDLEWKCVMLGDGPLAPIVRSAIQTHGMMERFELPGWVAPEDVLDCFNKGDILFMPSSTEGLPVVGVQALAKGLAFVTSKAGGFFDLVSDGKNGYLIDLADVDLFVSRIRALISDSAILQSFRSHSLAKADAFDLERIADQYLEIITKQVQSKGRRI